MKTWLLTLLLFFLPLIVFPFGTSPFEIPKVIVAEFGIILLIVLTFLEEESTVWRSISQTQILLSGTLVILTVIHLIFFRSATTLMGNNFRLQGVYLLWLLLLFSILSSRSMIYRIPRWVFWLSVALLSGTLFVFGTNETGRAVGSLGEPNALAATGIFLWPWLFFGNRHTHLPRWQKAISLIFIGLIVFVTGSRTGLVALTIQLVVIGLRHFMKWPMLSVVLVGVVLLSTSFLLPAVERGAVFENRAEVWLTAAHAGLKRPLFGHGFGNIEHTLRTQALKLSNNLRYQYVDSSHNLFLDWWVQGGVMGLGILLLFVAHSFKNFITQGNMMKITLFLGLLTVMSFNPVSVVTLVAFWWMIGQGFNKILDISG